MAGTNRPVLGDRTMRADARRSHDAIIAAAAELFGERGTVVQMDEIAERANVGMGTLYRHFETKQQLILEIIARRFVSMTELALAAEQVEDPRASLETFMVTYLEAAERDAAYRYALLGPEQKQWDLISQHKADLAAVGQRIVRRAVDAGVVRSDLAFPDFVLITRGVMANMSDDHGDWRRHLALMFDAIS